jgi:hypothetical protein
VVERSRIFQSEWSCHMASVAKSIGDGLIQISI